MIADKILLLLSSLIGDLIGALIFAATSETYMVCVEAIKQCEQNLPRDQYCVLTAVLAKTLGKE